ncbi:putative spermidine/putrescine transport system substrate-binding protein [Bosea sp. OK403]|uniref:ABC transporter substrate-binding protein n=1 Tax=Bosea sp. OK403 TaxID=1855286 RepID=UPI0008E4929A|nr:ABC transporter substrate-binding protein [Bosea sp. OK403]SFJ73079.1 putative spermidine/putrescine transport system substrate-binding protein [Bosea sp. OK403]
MGATKPGAKVVVANWGVGFVDAQRRAFFDPFEKETGIKVLIGGTPDLAKFKAQLASGTTDIDLSDLATGWIGPAEAAGLFAKIDRNIVDVSGLPSDAVRENALSYFTGGGGLAFSTDRYGQSKPAPTIWEDFWNVSRFPGRRALYARPVDTLEIALLADGVKPRELYPLDVERAFRSLDKIKPHIKTWYTTGAQPPQLIQSNDIDFAHAFHNRVFSAVSAGAKIAVSPHQNLLARVWTAPLAKSPNPEEAQRLLAFMLRPDRQAEWAKLQAVVPAVPAAMPLVDPNVMKSLPDPAAPDTIMSDISWWGPRLDDLNARFKEWLIT